jgi:hypothetical protein
MQNDLSVKVKLFSELLGMIYMRSVGSKRYLILYLNSLCIIIIFIIIIVVVAAAAAVVVLLVVVVILCYIV